MKGVPLMLGTPFFAYFFVRNAWILDLFANFAVMIGAFLFGECKMKKRI